MLIVYIKTSAFFKRQRFDDSKNEETTLMLYKYQYFDEYNNEKENDSDNNKYVSFPPTILPLLLQKESNHPLDLGKEINSLT